MEDENNKKEIEIDFDKIFDFFKKHQKSLIYLTLFLIILGGFYSRSADIPQLKHKYLISPDDPYVFLRYSKLIAQDGKLPSNDTLRYYPDGFDATRENALSAYVAGYTFKIIHAINPNVNMFDIGAYFAPVLFMFALFAFFFLADEFIKDKKISLIATAIFAFSPAILFRTVGGFLEKEPLFLPLMLTALYFFIKSYNSKKENKLYIYGILAGVFTGLAAFTSGLFFFIMMFVSVFLGFEVIFDKINLKKMKAVSIWLVLSYIITNLLTVKYGGILRAVKTLQFQLPLVATIIGWTHIAIKESKYLTILREKTKMIPIGITSTIVGIIIILLGGIILLGLPTVTSETHHIAQLLATPMTASKFGQSVSENQPPTFIGGRSNWWDTFGVALGIGRHYISIGLVFLMFFTGAILLFREEFKKIKYGNYLTWAFALFTLALTFEHFTGDRKYMWVNVIFAPQWAYALIFGVMLLLVLILNKSNETFKSINSTTMLLLSIYLVSIIAANGAVRLFFVMALPAAILSGYFVKWAIKKGEELDKNWIVIGTIVLALLVIIPSFIAVSQSVSHMNPGASGMELWYDALNWIKQSTPSDAIMTHWWDYGYLLQTMANRTTVVDPGNFYDIRNYDIGGHLFNAFNYSEILWFTDKYHFTNKSTYLVISSEDILKFVQIAKLGSLSEGTSGRETFFTIFGVVKDKSIVPDNIDKYKDEYPYVVVYYPITGYTPILKDFRIGNMLYDGERTYIMEYLQPISKNSTGPVLVRVYNTITKSMTILPVSCVCEEHKGCFNLNNSGVPTCAMPIRGGIINIPYKSKDILFTQLFLLDRNISGFEKVYDNNLTLDVNTARGAGPLLRIYKYNWSALENEQGW